MKGCACACVWNLGFRQCGSKTGLTGLNPRAQPWDAPLELRCAKNANLTEWGEPEYIFPVYYFRGLPYDPTRPWKDKDGKWCRCRHRRRSRRKSGSILIYRVTCNFQWSGLRVSDMMFTGVGTPPSRPTAATPRTRALARRAGAWTCGPRPGYTLGQRFCGRN